MIELLNIDCMEYMKGLDDNAFELAIVDPPYRDENQPDQWMRENGSMKPLEGRPNAEYWRELLRVSKEQIVWGANNFELPQWKGFVFWRKIGISNEVHFSCGEIAALKVKVDGDFRHYLALIGPPTTNRLLNLLVGPPITNPLLNLLDLSFIKLYEKNNLPPGLFIHLSYLFGTKAPKPVCL